MWCIHRLVSFQRYNLAHDNIQLGRRCTSTYDKLLSRGLTNVEGSKEDDLVGSRGTGGRGGEEGALRRTAQELVGRCQLEAS